jgi:hypothetical protein
MIGSTHPAAMAVRPLLAERARSGRSASGTPAPANAYGARAAPFARNSERPPGPFPEAITPPRGDEHR